MSSQADVLLNQVLHDLSLENATSRTIYENISRIVENLQRINSQSPIQVGTTGTITERLCEHGLRAAVPEIYHKLGRDWKWIGDFYVQGSPFNTIITVKSIKAKKSLLSSGTGNLLSPSIGYGLFNDRMEWSLTRIQSYLFGAFFIIYMPERTLDALAPTMRRAVNINGRPFLRSVGQFSHDLQGAVVNQFLDPHHL